MGKKKLLKQISDQKQQIEAQRKVTESVLHIFKILAEGGEIHVHIYPNQTTQYFVCPKGSKNSDYDCCSRNIFEGLYSRGLLVLFDQSFYESFAVQRYTLRIPKE